MGLIPEDIIAQVIDRADIVEIISGYIPLKRAGMNFKANCPFHNEKSPSFVVNPTKQIYHCFGCHEGGNVIKFVMTQDHMTFPEAVRHIAQKVNVTIPVTSSTGSQSSGIMQSILDCNALAAQYFQAALFSENDSNAKKARDYLKDRGVEIETAKNFQLGFAPDQWEGLLKHLQARDIPLSLIEKSGLIIARDKKDGHYDRFRNRIVFPILDQRGRYVAFGARAMGESTAKYINSPETPVYTKGRHLYGLNLARKAITEADAVIVCEGYMDSLMPVQAGVGNIVSALGTALTVDQIRLIKRFTHNVILLFDMDQAGEVAMLRSCDTLIEEGLNVKVARLTAGDDPDSFIRKEGVDAFRIQLAQAQAFFDYKMNVLIQKYDKGTPEGKASISNEMLRSIGKFNNAVLRAEYINRLARVLNVPESALAIELKQQQSNVPRPREEKVIKPSSVQKPPRAVEVNILKLLLLERRFVEKTRNELAVEDFSDSLIQKVVNRVYQLFDDGKDIESSRLMEDFDDPDVQKIISSLSVGNAIDAIDLDKMHKDCLKRVKDDKRKQYRKFLLEQMREAEDAGDYERLEQLKQKFQGSMVNM